MSNLRAQDRLQPALLDRLTDDNPGSQVEGDDARVISRNRLRDLVLRDLAWLLNCTAPGVEIDWGSAPQARDSVLNFGLPTLAGLTASSTDPSVLKEGVRRAILTFEPRILPETLVVEALVSPDQMSHHNEIGFRISGQLWAQPVPLELLLRTDIDLETGQVAVREMEG